MTAEQRSHHRVDLTSCLSLTLMRITVQTQLLNLHLNKERMKNGNVGRKVTNGGKDMRDKGIIVPRPRNPKEMGEKN